MTATRDNIHRCQLSILGKKGDIYVCEGCKQAYWNTHGFWDLPESKYGTWRAISNRKMARLTGQVLPDPSNERSQWRTPRQWFRGG